MSYQESQLYKIRHSTAHIMAQAVLEQFPEAQIAIGPPIEDGFYYDFELPRPLAADDLKAIEKRMKQIIKQGHEFRRKVVSAEEAKALFKDQHYKIELIEGLEQGAMDDNGNPIEGPVTITTYTQDTFEDLCRGPHVANSREINPKAISISFREPAGAYWRGDEKNQMLTRIYGTAWETPEDLQDYLHMLEEAKKRDHRVLGQKLNLFVIDPLVGKGLVLWKPKGAIVREALTDFMREAQREAGYLPVVTPNIGHLDLY
ncbi:MAG: threonine--tRNA ligase, partial [Anaerolineae bacterium]|nr:threonine--tRNA ligase [Anaerolineae bacterium]